MSLPIGINIKKLRNEQQITQEQLAEHLSISYQAISKWENSISVPDVSMLPLIAEYFGVTIDELFKPNMAAYKNKASRLLAIYESTRSNEAFIKAEHAYQKLLENSENYTHDNLLYYATLNHFRSQDYVKKAEELYMKSIELGKCIKDAAYYKAQRQLIALLCQNNRNQECIDKYEVLISKESGNIQNYVSLGMTYLLSKQYEKAWAAIEAGMKIDQKSALLLNLAGEACKCLGRYEDAIGFWDKSYCLDNEMPDNLYSKAYLYQEADQKEMAARVWEEIIQWNELRGFTVEAQSNKAELARLNSNKK